MVKESATGHELPIPQAAHVTVGAAVRRSAIATEKASRPTVLSMREWRSKRCAMTGSRAACNYL